MINLNNNKTTLNRELLLNLFVKFVQKQGKYIKAKKLIINISNHIDSKLVSKCNFVFIIEYIIYKLYLPMTMIQNKINKTKYYFLVMSLLRYIKKFIFSPFIKAVKSYKKLPFIYNFLGELQNILQDKSTLLDYREDVISVFVETNANIKINKYKKICNDPYSNNNFVYTNFKLKYLKRYTSYLTKFYNIKLYNIKTNINNKYLKQKIIKYK